MFCSFFLFPLVSETLNLVVEKPEQQVYSTHWQDAEGCEH